MVKALSTVELTESVVRILAGELKAQESRVRDARSLKMDVAMDSIAAANVLFELEDKYDIEIELEEQDSFDTVEAIVELLRRALESA